MLASKKFNPEIAGILCAIAAYAFFGLLNCAIRESSHFVDHKTLVSYRSFFCILIALPLLYFVPRKQFSFSIINKNNFLKAGIDLLSLPLWALAIKHMQITEVVALSFTTPIFSAILALIILKDRATFARCIALGLGFVGVFIIMNPKDDGINIYSFYVLLCCLSWSLSSILTKKLTNKQHPILIVLYSNILVFLISLPFNYMNMRALNASEAMVIIALAGLATFGNMLLAFAYKHTRITVIVPFDYTRLLFTTFFAYIFFEEVAKANTLIGAFIIIAGIFIAGYKK